MVFGLSLCPPSRLLSLHSLCSLSLCLPSIYHCPGLQHTQKSCPPQLLQHSLVFIFGVLVYTVLCSTTLTLLVVSFFLFYFFFFVLTLFYALLPFSHQCPKLTGVCPCFFFLSLTPCVLFSCLFLYPSVSAILPFCIYLYN